MHILNLVLHVLHITFGAIWVGGVVVMGFFVAPSAMATRPESSKFMQHLTGPAKLPIFFMIASWITILCGLAMYAPATGNLDAGVMRTPRGIAISLGALFAIGAFLEGAIVTGPTAEKLGKLGAAIAASGKGPTPEQQQQAQTLQTKLTRVARRGAMLLLTTVALMASARWL
jgi:hypothetical protein